MRVGQCTMHSHGGHPLMVTGGGGIVRGHCSIEHVRCEHGHELLSNDVGAFRDVAFALVLEKMANQFETIAIPIDDDLSNEHCVRDSH